MEILKRFLVACATGGLVLSTAAASAADITADVGVDAEGSMMISRCKRMHGDDRDECERRVRLQLDARAETGSGALRGREDSHGEFVSGMRKHAEEGKERLWDKAVKSVTHLIGRVGSVAKKFCRAQSDDTATVSQCVKNLQTSFQASVNAAITSAFSL